MAAFAPRSTAAQTQERDLEFRVRQLLITGCGVHEPELVRVEQEPERIVCLFTVQTLTGRAARTAFLTTDEPPLLVDGFVF